MRYAIMALAVMGTTVDYITRQNINEAVVAMVEPGSVNKTHAKVHEVCPDSHLIESATSNLTTDRNLANAPQFRWNENTQGLFAPFFCCSVQLI